MSRTIESIKISYFKVVELREDGILYKGEFCNFDEIKHLDFYMERRSVTYNVLIKMPSYYMAKTSVEKDNGSIVKIKVEGSEEQCNKIFYVYSVMKEKSFIKRYNLYVEDINQKGYFTYDGNYFYPDGKVISKKNEEYSINSNPTR